MSKEKEDIITIETTPHIESIIDSLVPISDFAGDTSLPPPPNLTPEQERLLWRKIDIRLLPVLSMMYLMAYMDRGNIGNAKLEGLEKQLNLKGNQFNIALTVFFFPYCLFESPANLLLKKFRPSRWLPAITVAWGMVVISMGFVKNFRQLVVTRLFLGMAESGLFPGIVYYLTFWYPRYKLQTRVGVFFGSASLAAAFSGLIAYGISFMSGTGGLLGWSWIFILEGLATVIVGFIALLVMVDFPATATFLTPEERAFVIHQKKLENSTVGEEEHLEKRHVWAAVTDWQIYLHIPLVTAVATPLYGMTLFFPSIIESFGHPPAISQLLTVPPFIVATIVVYVASYYSDKLEKRSPFVLGGLFLAFLGLLTNLLKVPYIVKYLGTFGVLAGTYGTIPTVVCWLGNNMSGQYKRGIGLALQVGFGNFSGTFASNIYRNKDAPRYILGNAISLMFTGIGLLLVPILVFTYKRINRKRDIMLQTLAERGEKLNPEEIKRLGDRAPTFRYVI